MGPVFPVLRYEMKRAKWTLPVLVALAAGVGTGLIAAQAGGDTAAADARMAETGEQPLVFPHDVHAGTLQIPCMYCHYSADISVDAGIPALSVCAGCHLPGGAPLVAADSPGVKILTEHWNEKRPIAWDRDHKLPDHVHFPHMMHVKAGLECQECHGPVEETEQVQQFASLQMGWCVECHRERQARTDCTVCHY